MSFRNSRWAAAAALAAVLPWTPGCRRAAQIAKPAARLESRHFQRDVPGCGDKTKLQQPCVTFSVHWQEVVGGPDETAARRINEAIRASLRPVEGAPADFGQEADALAGSFQKLKHEYPEMASTWFDRRSMEVLLNDGSLLTVAIERKWYDGGPAPKEAKRLFTFQISDGRQLTLDELLAPTGRERFNRQAEKRLRFDRNIDPDIALPEVAIALRGGKFSDCRDIGALPKGLQLHFDPGVFGEAEAGAIDILITWEELAPALRPGTPVEYLAGR